MSLSNRTNRQVVLHRRMNGYMPLPRNTIEYILKPGSKNKYIL